LVLNVPYGGLFMPPIVEKRLKLKREELGWENYRLTDPFLLELVRKAAQEAELNGSIGKKTIPQREIVAYRFSPLVSDPLGLLSAQLGGSTEESPHLFIRKSTQGTSFPEWNPQEAELILKKSSLPYLRELRDKCLEALESDTLVLLLTLRSYSTRPLNFETDRRFPRPQLCIGSRDEKKSPHGLASFIGRTLRIFNFWPELNWPHEGSYIPPDLEDQPRLFSATLSFRRDLYMDEEKGSLSPNHESLSRVLRTIFSLLEEELETVLKIRYQRRHPPKPPSMVIKAQKH
jgi:hypothetical protein